MNESEKERLIKKDIASIENRVRHAFNQGYEMGLKENKEQGGDAISRQAVLDLMRGLTRWCVRSEDGKWNNVGLLYDDVMFGIDRLPSVTPQQKKGRWIEGYEWVCSNCGTLNRALYKCCSHCGKMEVENAD